MNNNTIKHLTNTETKTNNARNKKLETHTNKHTNTHTHTRKKKNKEEEEEEADLQAWLATLPRIPPEAGTERQDAGGRSDRSFRALSRGRRPRSVFFPASPQTNVQNGCGSKLNHQGTAGFSPCFPLPRFHFRYLFLDPHPNERYVGCRSPRIQSHFKNYAEVTTIWMCLFVTRYPKEWHMGYARSLLQGIQPFSGFPKFETTPNKVG